MGTPEFCKVHNHPFSYNLRGRGGNTFPSCRVTNNERKGLEVVLPSTISSQRGLALLEVPKTEAVWIYVGRRVGLDVEGRSLEDFHEDTRIAFQQHFRCLGREWHTHGIDLTLF